MKARIVSILVVFFTLLTPFWSQGQYFHCLEVEEDGDILLEWTAPIPQSDFVSYQIYRQNPSGNFTVVHTETDFNSTNWTDNVANGDLQSYTYFIRTITTQGSVDSDTLNSIHLTLVIISQDPDVISLNWNAIQEPLSSLYDPEYDIVLRTTEFPTFVQIDSTSQLNYTMPITICQSGVSFRIEIKHASGCTARSNITYDVLGDSYAPPMPKMDSVSIDLNTGEVILGWSASSATDAVKYYIYHDQFNINEIYDTVFGRFTTSYVDSNFDPCTENRGWAISAEDSCGNIGPGTYDIPQRTILLQPVDFNPCTMVNTLDWSAYINMEPALEGYRIYLSEDGAPFELHTVVDSNVTTYQHQGLDPYRNYRYYIRAFSLGASVTSTSCIQELNTWQYRRPLENDMENASVENSDFVFLTFLPDTFATVPFLKIYRSESDSGPWSEIDELSLSGQSWVSYEDLTADVNSTSYYYYSSIVDSCGNEVLESDTFRTIFLSGTMTNQVNSLEWNAFKGWPGGVDDYEVYRALGDDPFVSIDQLGNNTLTYEDDISVLPGDFSIVRYVIKANSDAIAAQESWSNEIFFEFHPQIYLPNAFRPEGVNSEYKPVGNFANFSEYRMEIYNRWGEMVFSTDNFGTGWDGTVGGKEAPLGTYVCKLNYQSTTGRTETMTTTLVLLR